jgi:3-hydroxyacyl-[acyl-carrier-protein] dehydratase
VRFILIDEILEVTPGKTIRGSKFVSPDEDYFKDHFPGFPVVPGVLLVEMMAQTVGKCLDMENQARGKSMLGKISNANFRSWVKPGETVFILGQVTASQPQFATATCHVEVNGCKVASAEFLFSFVAANQFAPGYRDEVIERYLARCGTEVTANASK